MVTSKLMFYTVYAHDLKEPWKSFDKSLKLSDFKLDKAAYHAESIIYLNPRLEEVILYKTKGVKRV